MENKMMNLVRQRQKTGCESLYTYATLVADLEFLAIQNPNQFNTKSAKENYIKIWNEMEILNACALDEWETMGKQEDFSNMWEEKYKRDATSMLCKLIDFLEKLR